MKRVEGKVAAITGAARGLGRSHAIRLAEEGADIIAIDICEPVESAPYDMASQSDLAETVRLVEALGRTIVSRQADVRDLSALQAALEDGIRDLGSIDILIANAGIVSYDSAVDMPEQKWQDVIDINLTGTWHTVKAAIPLLADGSSVILVSSVAGLAGGPTLAHYSAAKHGVVGLMRSLAIELAAKMIRVNSIHPTSVNTDMIHNEATYRLFRPDLPNPTRSDFTSVAAEVNLLPVPAIEPIDVSNAVLFLASDESRYVTGTTLTVDAGGLTK